MRSLLVSLTAALATLLPIGSECAAFMDVTLRNLTPARIECDEIWAFCYAKQKNVPEDFRDTPGYGESFRPATGRMHQPLSRPLRWASALSRLNSPIVVAKACLPLASEST